jgi:hypothetical protein
MTAMKVSDSDKRLLDFICAEGSFRLKPKAEKAALDRIAAYRHEAIEMAARYMRHDDNCAALGILLSNPPKPIACSCGLSAIRALAGEVK